MSFKAEVIWLKVLWYFMCYDDRFQTTFFVCTIQATATEINMNFNA